MQNSALEARLDSSYPSDANQSWIEQLYEDFSTDPDSVDASWRSTFQQSLGTGVKPDQFHSRMREHFRRLAKGISHYSSTISDPDTNVKQVKTLRPTDAYRPRGHQHANLDPLGLWQQGRVADLDPSPHDLTEADSQETFNIGSFASGKETMKLGELLEVPKQAYCGPIGAEYIHITSTEERRWIQQHIESGHATFNSKEKKRFLSELTAVEDLERYLGARFPGAKHFSLEGGDALILMPKKTVRHAGNSGTREVILGMAHRGRLNVLMNMLGKKPRDSSDEFASKHKEHLGIGDVKYHMGFSSDFQIDGGLVHLALTFNLPHLEIVSPAVIGSVRTHPDRFDESGSNKALSITIHSDAVVTGQGVAQETLNMPRARGYEAGGMARIVINNQAGFATSNPLDARSALYCIDISKMVQAPIFHANADGPEAVAFVTRLALDFRNTLKRDVLTDLVCYRRHGHNKADESNAIQPLMYQKIKEHLIPRKVYTDKLEQEEMATLEDATEMVNLYRDALDAGDRVVAEWRPMNVHSSIWSPYLNHERDEEYPNKVEMKRLQELAKRISTVPEAAEMQPRAVEIYGGRQAMAAGEKLSDWGGAENLAYATLADEGIPTRLSGRDSDRGIFFHRYAVIHNQSNSSTYTSLQHTHNNQGAFRVRDSALSEEVVLAFEYGYAAAEPCILTIQEAQSGDFTNGAQVVIDQLVSFGEQKWGRMCGLVMLLPHGYKGQGLEHSSVRLKRYLQFCAEQNMQAYAPSTPAQVYHMLHRQALRGMYRPLVVMSPKSLLRHPLAVSSPEELANGIFLLTIGEIDELDPKGVKRVVMCPGKVYYDLLEQHRKNNQHDVAIVCIEQLYPSPYKVMQEVLQQFAHVKDLVWCQEEPPDQGVWYCSQHHFREVISFGVSLHYAGRPASAPSAVGYMPVHQKQQ